MAAAVGGVAFAGYESVGFERVEQGDEHARGHVHRLYEVALGQSAVVVQQSEDLKLPRLEVVGGVSGAQAVHRLLPEQRQQQAWAGAVLVKDARRIGGCGVGGCGHQRSLCWGTLIMYQDELFSRLYYCLRRMNRRFQTRSLNQPMSTTDQTPTTPT